MITYRFAEPKDVDMYFEWANDSIVRENSYNKEQIEYKSHFNWFHSKIQSPNVAMYLFSNENDEFIGQVRIEKEDMEEKRKAIISINISKEHRGKGYSAEMLRSASTDFLVKNPSYKIFAYIFVSNKASYKSFVNAGFKLIETKEVQGIQSYILEKC